MSLKIKNNQASRGFTLLEALIAVFIVTIIGIAALSLLNVRAVGVLDNKDSQEAETRAEEALSGLVAIAQDLEVGGTFQVVADSKIRISGECTDQTCDYVLIPAVPDYQRTSPAKGYPFTSPIPDGSQVLFLRRWSIEDTNSDYGLRKITVAVMKNAESDQPMLLEDTVVAITR